TTMRVSSPSPIWRARSSPLRPARSVSPVWLTPLVASEGGAAAHRRAQALGPEVHAEIVASADRLAASSSVLAQRCYLHAATAWQAFGAAGLRRWVAIRPPGATGTPRGLGRAPPPFARPAA